MPVIILKFLEVGSRAVFVVLTSYSLEIEQAGQFGLVVTLQGLASFAFGYERHVDVMRRMVGQSHGKFDRAVAQALSLCALNYTWGIPLLVVSLILMVHLQPVLIALCVVIAIAEQLMNNAYHMAMVEPRYRKMLAVTVIKNVVIAAAVVAGVIWTDIDLPVVLKVWAAASAVGLVFIALFWLTLRRHEPDDERRRDTLVRQYRASWMHFLLGLTAVLTIQIDRLLVGALLSLAEAGIYFRHVLLVAMLYQVFNIAFYNRILPNVFAQARRGDVALLVRIVRREYWNVVSFWTLAAVSGVVLHVVTDGSVLDRFGLDHTYLIGFLLMTAMRSRADLNALVFNALHQEKTVFHLQLLSFAVSLPMMIILAHWYGIPGLIFASCLGALLYLLLSTLKLSRMSSVTIHDA